MATTTNKNKQYTDKYFLVNRLKKTTDTTIKNELTSKVNLFLAAVKNKHV
jgi:hypothetical protein